MRLCIEKTISSKQNPINIEKMKTEQLCQS